MPNFKNSNGLLFTKRLFYEMSYSLTDLSDTIYTLKDDDFTVDSKTYVSLYKRYMEMEDTSEFLFATTYFESYEHFAILTKTPWFADHIARWRKELELKLKSRAYENLKTIASNPQDKNYFEANKIILKGGLHETKEKKSTRGRPGKDEIEKAVKEIAQEERLLNDDHARIFGVADTAQ